MAYPLQSTNNVSSTAGLVWPGLFYAKNPKKMIFLDTFRPESANYKVKAEPSMALEAG